VETPPPETTPPTEAPPATPPADTPPAATETAPPATTAEAAAAPAQAPPPVAKEEENVQELGKHVFPVPAFIPWSFVSTHFSFRQAVVNISVPDFPLRLDREKDVSMTGLLENIEFGARFWDPLEITLALGGQMIVGNGVDSILTLGATYSYNFGGGVTFRVLRLEGTQLSLRGRFTWDSGGSLEMLKLIDALQGVTADEVFDQQARDVVLEDTSRREFFGHVLLAQSLGPVLGLQASLGIGRDTLGVTGFDTDTNEDVEVSHTDWAPEGGLVVDANFHRWLPLGVTLEYVARSRRYDDVSGTESEKAFTHLIGLGLFTQTPHFQITLTTAHLLGIDPLQRTIAGETRESGDPVIDYGQLSVHTFW
jgi:hypothetical protein